MFCQDCQDLACVGKVYQVSFHWVVLNTIFAFFDFFHEIGNVSYANCLDMGCMFFSWHSLDKICEHGNAFIDLAMGSLDVLKHPLADVTKRQLCRNS